MVTSNLSPNLVTVLFQWADEQFNKGMGAALEIVNQHLETPVGVSALDAIDVLVQKCSLLEKEVERLKTNEEDNPLVQACFNEISLAITGSTDTQEVTSINDIVARILGFGDNRHHAGAAGESSHNKENCILCQADKDLENETSS